jgi:hypothetical protein
MNKNYIALDLKEKAGQSEQIDFYGNDKSVRTDDQVIGMHHGWKAKRVSEVRFKNT